MSFYSDPTPVTNLQAVRSNSNQSSSFTAAGNYNYFVDATSGAVTVTLPSSTANQSLLIKKTDSSANAVTLSGTLDGAVTTLVLTRLKQSKELYADGSGGWNVVTGNLDVTTLNASGSAPGLVQLTGDLGGSATSPTVPALSSKVTGSGTATITVGTTAPASPVVGDLWVDTN